MKKFDLKTALAELEKIEASFQQPELDLDEALLQHRRATELASEIFTYLEQAETVLETLSIKSDLEEAEEQ